MGAPLAHGNYLDDLAIPVVVVLAFLAAWLRRSIAPEVGPEAPCPYCGAPAAEDPRCPRCGFRLERYAASQGAEGRTA